MEGDAQYFHATLYRFGDAARREVIERFHASMRDPAARCTYNADQHCFSLICPPGPVGPHADEELVRIISSHITEAPRAAEDSDQPPGITRFPESLYDVEVDDAPSSHDPGHEVEGWQPEDVPRVPRLLHVINPDGATMFRFFQLDALPQGLSERTLTPRVMTRKKYMENGSTLRSATATDWLFDGRVGQPLPPISTGEETAMLKMAPFARLQGTAERQEQPFTITPWRFQGSAVSTSQWLQGLGQIEQDDPEQEPQHVPREFQKMMVAEQSHQNPALGRVRVPAGAADALQDRDGEDESDGRYAHAEAAETGFRLLLAGDAPSENSEEDAGSSENEGVGGTKKSFMHLLRGAPSTSPPSSKLQSRLRPEADRFVRPSRPAWDAAPADRVASDIMPRAHSAGGTETGGSDEFGSYGPPWATCRSGMLQADPGTVAEWQNEHPTPMRAPPSEMSVAAIGSYQDDTLQTTGLPPWTNMVVQNRAARGAALVDVAAAETRRPIMPPPGLMPTVAHQIQNGRQQAQPRQPASGQLIDHETNLHDEPDTQRTRAQLPPGHPLQPLVAATRSRTNYNTSEDDHDVVERMERSAVEGVPSKRFTMRQKAQKKGKGRTVGKAAGAKAKLPMPSPPPPPPSRPAKTPAQPAVQPSPTNSDRIADFLADIKESWPAATVELHFGQILSIIEDRKGTRTADGATNIVSNVDIDSLHFVPAMTSRLADAHYMLHLSQETDAIMAKTFYEIHIKDIAGAQTRILVTSNPLEVVAIPSDEDDIGTVAMHFPIRIWDSVLKVMDAGAVAMNQIPASFDEFLQSMRSCGGQEAGEQDSPNFIAKVPANSFTVERVYAKREWSRSLHGSGSLAITECQDMLLQSLDEPHANLEVTVLQSRDGMVNDHRLWYEAQIDGLEDATAICHAADMVISHIDGVGFYNRGATRYNQVVEQKPPKDQVFRGGQGVW